MKTHNASVDAGNGGVNAVLASKTKSGYRYKTYYGASVRASATGDSLGIAQEMDYKYVDWNGHRYIVGDDVTRVTKRGLDRHTGHNRYGNELYQMLVANALAELGVKDGKVDLTLFAPPGMYAHVRPMIEERFMENPVTRIKLKGDKKTREWEYNSITVWPEGIGAAMCFAIGRNGNMIETDALNGEVVVLDVGAHTLDALKMVNGDFNPEQLEHATWEARGVDVHIRQPILRVIKNRDDDFAGVTVDDIDRVIRRGLVLGDDDGYTLTVAGKKVNLKPLIKKYSEHYAGWVANNICDTTFNGFRGIRAVILVGGGAVLIENYLKEWYGDKLLDRNQYLETKKLHPVDMNAEGGVRLSMWAAKQRKARGG